MINGVWLLVNGKKVAAVRLPDGTVEPLPADQGPAPVVELSPQPSVYEEAD